MLPLDLTKFRKDLTKNLSGIEVGFHDPRYWISTGNYALNYMISNDFNRGIPLGKVVMFGGEPGSGKSFLVSGNIAANAQKAGHFVVIIDTENALDSPWLLALGVDVSEDKLLKLSVSMIDDVAKIISDFVKQYRAQYGQLDPDDRPKVLFIIDSLGMLLTPVDVGQFTAGDMKGDFGRKAKALTALVRNCVNMFGGLDLGLVVTNHTYSSQDMFDPDPKISGGSGFMFASSIVLALRKLKLKEDEHGTKVADVRGIRSIIKCMKTRYNKPFEVCEIHIPWDKGMNPYSGLISLFIKKGLLTKDGTQKLQYISLDGEVFSKRRKAFDPPLLDKIMSEFHKQLENSKSNQPVAYDDEPEDDTPLIDVSDYETLVTDE